MTLPKTLRQVLLERFALVGGCFALASLLVFLLTPHPVREFAELFLLRDSARAAVQYRNGLPLQLEQPTPTRLFVVRDGVVTGPQPFALPREGPMTELQRRPMVLGLGTRLDASTLLWAEARVPRGFYQIRGNPDSMLRWALGALALILATLWVGSSLTRQVRGQLRALARQAEGEAVEAPREPREVAQVAASLARLAQRVQQRQSELEASRQVLRQAVEERSRLLAVVSHELRTPLTGLLGAVHTLLDGLEGPVTQEAQVQLERLQQLGGRLLDQIERLLHSGRAEAGLLAPVDGEVFLHDCLEDACQELGFEPELALPPRSPVVRGDHAVLKMVLTSLLLGLSPRPLKLTVEGAQLRAESSPGEGIPFLSVESAALLLEKMGAQLESRTDGFTVRFSL